MRLTKTVVDAAIYSGNPETNERVVLWDDKLSGFGLRVYPSGRKAFVLSYRYRGRKRLLTLGRYSEVFTLAQAKTKAQKTIAKLDEQDPLAERQREQAPTLGEIWKRYLEEYAQAHKKARTVADEKGTWRRHLERGFSKRRLDEITREDVQRLHHKLRNSPYAANDAVKLLRRLYSLAGEEWGLVSPDMNPARRIKLFKEARRERYLSSEEISRLGQALREAQEEGEDPYAIAAVRLLLLTGARAGEILGLRWDEVDFQSRLLRLRDSKTGPKGVELAAPALEVLAGLQRLRMAGSPWVFPGRDPAKPRNDYIKRSWAKIRQRAGLEDVRLHDLRHSFASMGAAAGYSLKMVGELLGHAHAATTDRYAHLARDPRKEANERIAGEIAAALEDHPGGTPHLMPFGVASKPNGLQKTLRGRRH